ncbi:hypothetical protein TNCV_4735441 [Trichonephila clavipes]|nr:hypothetical protein TNCV_4735441 [Trichonephila clavipes]
MYLVRRLAATNRTFHPFQQGYEFRNDVYVDGWSFQWTSLKTVSTFVFTMDAIPDRFRSATDHVSRNRCTINIIIDVFGAVSPGFC